MTTYIPAFETQRDENAPTPWTNCNAASHAMLADLHTYGQIDTSDVAIRRASPVPLGDGMNFAQVGDAIAKIHPELGRLRYSESHGWSPVPMKWGELLSHLRQGGGAVVCGNYGDVAFRNSRGWGEHRAQSGLLIRRWQPTGTFGHAVFVCDAGNTDVLLMDPLGHGDYAGDRIPIDALWSFIWKEAWRDEHVRVTAAHGFTSARPAQLTAAQERTERRKREVWQLRRELPEAADNWKTWTGLHEGNRGKPLTQDGPGPAYLPAEILFLRRERDLRGK